MTYEDRLPLPIGPFSLSSLLVLSLTRSHARPHASKASLRQRPVREGRAKERGAGLERVALDSFECIVGVGVTMA